MREIKFRFYGEFDYSEAPEMLYGDKWAFEEYLPIDDIFKQVQSGGTKVMQYTGLKDKNGVEIYEGDIISLAGSVTGSEGLNPGFFFDEDDRAEIAWDADIAAWSLAGELDRTDRVEVTYRNHAIQLIHQGACEVIGNIYENPELLEDKS